MSNIELQPAIDYFDVLVVGSGYGASVAALRSAEAGKSVCVLERGRAFAYGQFPRTLREVILDVRLRDGLGRADGLFEILPYKDLTVLKGSGLGGGSLINAGVAERPNKRVFQDEAWPRALRNVSALESGFARAADMLGLRSYPEGEPGYPVLAKTEALRELARKEGVAFHSPLLSVHFGRTGYNRFGKYQEACANCGNCFTGCNFNAKNSLDKNYLAQAQRLGAELRVGFDVSHLARGPRLDSNSDERTWFVYYRETPEGHPGRVAPRDMRVLRAREVYLGAGTPGSVEILLRSREIGRLALSPLLGRRVSANSGTFAAMYNTNRNISMFGLKKGVRGERRSGEERRNTNTRPGTVERRSGDAPPGPGFEVPVGPTITGVLGFPVDQNTNGNGAARPFIIEDSAIPSSIAPFAHAWWPFIAALGKMFGASGAEMPALPRIPGAHARSGMFLAVGHDDSDGRFVLGEPDNPRRARADLVWPGLANRENYARISQSMRELFADYEGIFSNAGGLAGINPVTVHPLGGCAMGDDSSRGVTDAAGRVFDPEGGRDAVHVGLYVCDSSLIPRSLGTNPLWTITAAAERALEEHNRRPLARVKERNAAVGAPIPGFPQASTRSLSLRETMAGHWGEIRKIAGAGPEPTFEQARARGRERGLSARIELSLELHIEDWHTFVSDPEHKTRVFGSVDAPGLDPGGRLSIFDGEARLFAPLAGSARDRLMDYHFRAAGPSGRVFVFSARKELSAGHFLSVSRTLFQAELSIASADGVSFARGLIDVDLARFFGRTALDIRSRGRPVRAGDRMAFYRFFLNELAGLSGVPRLLRSREVLRAPETAISRGTLEGIPATARIEEYPFLSGDGLGLRLRRIRPPEPARNAPAVLLIHGLTSSADMFIMPEHKNLTTVLLERGFEVWLLDFRMSNRFLYNTMSHLYSLDDVALFDMAPAVELIRDIIGMEPCLHVVAHCLGSLSFSLALFGGLLGDKVDSFVSNSVSLAVELPTLSALRLRLLVESGILENTLRMPLIDPEALFRGDWLGAMLARGLSLYHHECDNSVCHMLSFMWGSGRSAVFEHKNLHPLTHARLEQLFGPTTFHYHRHVLRLHDASGAPRFHMDKRFDSLPRDYMDGVGDNRVPVLFVSGEHNRVFGKSQERMYTRLRDGARPELYRYALVEDYGHQDVFMGVNAAADVFGVFLDFWEGIMRREYQAERPRTEAVDAL